MRTTTILAVIVAAAVIGAAATIYFLPGIYNESKTTVIVGSGLTVTINGEEVTDGQEFVLDGKNVLDIHVESALESQIRVSGKWTSDMKTFTKDDVTASPVSSADFSIQLKNGKYTGKLAIFDTISNGSDLAPIELKFTVDESKVKVSWSGGEIKDGDTVTFTGDTYVTVESKIGRADLSLSGSWSNDCGMSGGANQTELCESMSVQILDTIFFDKAYGTMKVTATPEK